MLKESATKTSKGLVTSVALAVCGSSWYVKRLEHYMQFLPVVLKRGPELASMVSTLEAATTFSEDNLTKMLGMTSDFAAWAPLMPPGSTEKFEKLFLDRAVDYSKQCLELMKTAPPPEDTVRMLEKAMAEAGILNPMDPDLLKHQDNLAYAQMVARCKISWAELQDASLSVTKHLVDQSGDSDSLSESLTTVLESASKAKKVTDETPATCVDAVNMACAALVQHIWEQASKNAKLEKAVVEALTACSKFLGDELSTKVSDLAGCYATLFAEANVCAKGLVAKMESLTDDFLNCCLDLSRHYMRVAQAKASVPKKVEGKMKELLSAMGAAADDSEARFKSVIKDALALVEESLKQKTSDLASMTSGGPGKEWMEFLTTKKVENLTELFDVSKDTLLAVDVDKQLAAMKAVEQV